MIKRYMKKPVIIVEAVQFNGENTKEVLMFIYPTLNREEITTMDLPFQNKQLKHPNVLTSGGIKPVFKTQYIIKDQYGAFSVITQQMFNGNYEEIINN